jgi:hypothetical protein
MNADQKKKNKRAVPGMNLHDPRPGLLGGGVWNSILDPDSMNADQKKKNKRAVPGMDLHDPRPGLLGGGVRN